MKVYVLYQYDSGDEIATDIFDSKEKAEEFRDAQILEEDVWYDIEEVEINPIYKSSKYLCVEATVQKDSEPEFKYYETNCYSGVIGCFSVNFEEDGYVIKLCHMLKNKTPREVQQKIQKQLDKIIKSGKYKK